VKLLKDLITEGDNITYDIARVSGASMVLTYLGLAIYSVVWKAQHFDPQSFGIGAGAVVGALGAALRLTREDHHDGP
jgi:hypothetical protein